MTLCVSGPQTKVCGHLGGREGSRGPQRSCGGRKRMLSLVRLVALLPCMNVGILFSVSV